MSATRFIRLTGLLAAAVASMTLTSGAALAAAPAEQMPGGSWSRDCTGAAMTGTVLTASCPGLNNAMTASTLDLATCNPPAEAANLNGHLVCGTGLRISAPGETSPASQLLATGTPPPEVSLADNAWAPFAGEWDIVTERGDGFRLTAEQTGNAFIGAVPFGDQRLQMNGVVGAEKKLTLVWQIGNLAGTGELSLSEDGKTLQGQLQSEGGPIEGGTWTGTRPGSGPVALPLGETPKTAALPQATDTPTPPSNDGSTVPDGFQTATVASAVSIRDKPSSKPGESRVIGTLSGGKTVSVRCATRFWCELSEGGFVSASFLRLGDSAASEDSSSSAAAATTTSKPETPASPAGDLEPQADDFGSNNGISLEQMLDGLFKRRVAE